MLYNYLRIYFRSLLKNRFTGCINIAVLAICFTCTLVMSAIVVDDLAFDRHFSQEERIYRVLSNKVANGVERRSALTPASLAFDLSGQTPDVEVATRIMAPDEGFLFKDGYAHKQSIVYTDSAFLKIFNLRLLVGSVERALENAAVCC